MFTPATWNLLPVTIPFARPAASWWLNAAATKLPASTKTATARNAAKKLKDGGVSNDALGKSCSFSSLRASY